MRPAGSPDVWEHRRRLAVQCVRPGYSIQGVADFLCADPSSVRRGVASLHRIVHTMLDSHGGPERRLLAGGRCMRRWPGRLGCILRFRPPKPIVMCEG